MCVFVCVFVFWEKIAGWAGESGEIIGHFNDAHFCGPRFELCELAALGGGRGSNPHRGEYRAAI